MKLPALLIVVALAGCATEQVFKANASRLQSGMNRAQVEALLGAPDREELRVCGLLRQWTCLAWSYRIAQRNALGWPYKENRLQIFFRNAREVALEYPGRRVEPSIMVYQDQQDPTWIVEKWNWL